MGGAAFYDVAGVTFWLFIAVAVLLMNATPTGMARKSLLAFLNLGFCALVVGLPAAVVVAVLLFLLHGVIRMPRRTPRRMALAVTALALLAAFLFHKWPASGSESTLEAALAALGFSYIALRVVEVLRAAAEVAPDESALVDTVNYVIPFHMLMAGPIMALADHRRESSVSTALDGEVVLNFFERIARGLFKKFVLANGLIDTVFLTGFQSEGVHWLLEVQMYYLFIYLDFSAYSDIAVGIGRLLGVPTPENFKRPLLARNIVSFWERWHISLSQFIRRNVFIPVQLAGMRLTRGQHALWVAAVAFTVSFALCGLWHGLSWRFLLWGLGHAAALIVCNLYRQFLLRRLGAQGLTRYLARPGVRVVSTILTFEFVAFSLAFLADPALKHLD